MKHINKNAHGRLKNKINIQLNEILNWNEIENNFSKNDLKNLYDGFIFNEDNQLLRDIKDEIMETIN
jgi:hypothetical protein